MNTITNLIVEARTQLEGLHDKFVREENSLKAHKAMLEDIADHWTYDVDILKMFKQTDEWWVDVKVEDQNAAMVLMEIMNPVSMYLIRDGWTGFSPDFLLNKKYEVQSMAELNKSRLGAALIDPYYYEVRDNFNNYDHSLLFWIKCGDQKIKVRVIIENPDRQDRGVDYRHRTVMGGQVIDNIRTFDKSGLFNMHWALGRGSDSQVPRAYFCRG